MVASRCGIFCTHAHAKTKAVHVCIAMPVILAYNLSAGAPGASEPIVPVYGIEPVAVPHFAIDNACMIFTTVLLHICKQPLVS